MALPPKKPPFQYGPGKPATQDYKFQPPKGASGMGNTGTLNHKVATPGMSALKKKIGGK